MRAEIEEIKTAQDLPQDWDDITEGYFQNREFLIHAEHYNPCCQRYYALFQNGSCRAGAIAYTLRLDLLTYLGIPSPFKMRIIGIPCSVSSAGIFGDEQSCLYLYSHIQSKERGLVLFLNLNSIPAHLPLICGKTFPSVVLENMFNSFEEYSDSLKSTYRRRMKRISASFEEIETRCGSCSRFTKAMHDFYLQVYARSRGKLEKLSLGFFQHLPPLFQLTSFWYRQDLQGWYVSVFHNKTFYFFMGGVDYQNNERFHTYFNILLSALREGIEKKAAFIDFGQTAEIPKTRLGGKIIEKQMAGYHSFWLVRKLLQRGKRFLEYSRTVPPINVFRTKA